MMLLTDGEIRDMALMGNECGIEVCLFVGPRAPWEGTGQALTPDGKLFGWRHTGMDQLRYALENVLRGVELGIRSILVADEGLLWLVHQAKLAGKLPAELVVKGSALLGAANPVGIRLLAEAGMTTINVASDISPARLAALRQVVAIPVDLYIESPDGLGGFTRYYEMPETHPSRCADLLEVRPAQRTQHLSQRHPSGAGGGALRPRRRAARPDRPGIAGPRRCRLRRLATGRSRARHPGGARDRLDAHAPAPFAATPESRTPASD